jgi:hypothetical protein
LRRMGDRSERARAWRGVSVGSVLTLLVTLATVALAVAIPTQGENPRAWGILVCGLVTVGVCARIAWRNWMLLRHFRGDDLARPPRSRRATGQTSRRAHAS